MEAIGCSNICGTIKIDNLETMKIIVTRPIAAGVKHEDWSCEQ